MQRPLTAHWNSDSAQWTGPGKPQTHAQTEMYYSANKRANNVGHYVLAAAAAAAVVAVATEITKKDVRFVDGKKTKQSYKITWRQSRRSRSTEPFSASLALSPLFIKGIQILFLLLPPFLWAMTRLPMLSTPFFLFGKEKTLFHIDRYYTCSDKTHRYYPPWLTLCCLVHFILNQLVVRGQTH